MIERNMNTYNYYTLSNTLDAYGQHTVSFNADNSTPAQVVMAIFLTGKQTQDNINYAEAKYIGLTSDTNINTTCIVKYGNKYLKVLFVYPEGRLRQVFMTDYE